MKIFGYQFRWVEPPPEEKFVSFTPPTADDGAVTVAASAFAASYIDLEGTVRTEAELITRYRKMAINAELAKAIDEIVDECVTKDESNEVVKIFLDDIEISPKLKKLIEIEFENILKLLKFNTRYHTIFKNWYVDGRLYYHAIIDDKKTDEGIQECRYIDPRKIRKVREIVKMRGATPSDTLIKTKVEYYIYNDRGFSDALRSTLPNASGLRIAKDSIAYVTSGLLNEAGTMILSYLHPAIKPLNELRTVEDATVIYRITRAPERRVWYIDVGQLPKIKAEQYVRDIMTSHKNRLIYDSATGEIKDDRRFMTMLEDYWLPQREGRGTKVDTLKAGENLGKMEDVEYFRRKLYEALFVPVARLEPENAVVSIGAPDQLSREELKFSKFCDRLKARFAILFTELLEKQLVLKKIFSIEEFQVFKDQIEYKFSRDSMFAEFKDNQIMMMRMQLLQLMQPYIGMYYSNKQVRKEILKQDDSQIEEIDKEIEEEQQSYQYLAPDQKMMLQQQEMDQQQADAEAASPQGQAKATIDQVGQNPNPSLQDLSKEKRAKKVIGG